MAEPKTQPTTHHPLTFLQSVEPVQRKEDGLALLPIFEAATGEKAVMWGPSIVGFGNTLPQSKRNEKQQGWPLVAFSPRKQNLTLYIMSDAQENAQLFEHLGQHKTSKACVYINKLSDVDVTVLSQIIRNAYQHEKLKIT